MRSVTYRDALREALREEMLANPDVFLIGEDIGVFGSSFKVTTGLWEEFGPKRIIETPISEAAIVGAAAGAAACGLRPVAEISFMDFIGIAMDQILSNVAKMHYMSNGLFHQPLVIRSSYGAGGRAGLHHSQSLEALFAHIPGLYVAMPATPYDAKGMLKSAIRDDNPVLFLEHKLLYGVKGPVPEEEYLVPLGKAEVRREGQDVTIVATGAMVSKALRAAVRLEEEGIDAEVVDLRTVRPLDVETVVGSVKKTGRLVVTHEDHTTCGVAAEVAAIVSKEAFGYIDAPIERVCAPDTPVPFSPPLEDYYLPNEDRLVEAALGTVMLGRAR